MDQRRLAIVDALLARATILIDAQLAVCSHAVPPSFRRGFSSAQYYQLSDANKNDEDRKISSSAESKTAEITLKVIDDSLDKQCADESICEKSVADNEIVIADEIDDDLATVEMVKDDIEVMTNEIEVRCKKIGSQL
jgi:hypothetical protein